MKLKKQKRYIIFSVLILLFLYFGPLLNGYSLIENSAIRYSYPNQSGKNVFEKEFGKKKVVIWDTDTENYIKLISKNWGVLYQSTMADSISIKTLDNKMKFTWSATLKDDKYYDTLFAVEVLDTNIVKVIVSNEKIYESNYENF